MSRSNKGLRQTPVTLRREALGVPPGREGLKMTATPGAPSCKPGASGGHETQDPRPVLARIDCSFNPTWRLTHAAGLMIEAIHYSGPLFAADIDDDGFVDLTDMLRILAAWGPCAGG